MKRLFDNCATVMAVIAAIAGVRPGICMIAVPTLILLVFASIQAAGRDRVGAVCLGCPHRVVAKAFGVLDRVHRDADLAAGVTGDESEFHGVCPLIVDFGGLIERCRLTNAG